MSLTYKTLRPGVLVGLKTAIKGENVTYDKTVIEAEHVDELGQLVGSWQTDKTVADAAEYELAVTVRSKARNLVTGICAKSDFGYLCPDDKLDALEAAIAKAEQICEEFNLTARITEIVFSTLKGRIATDDDKAIRAIKGELVDLLDAMDAGLKALDVKGVRAVVKKAKSLGTMLAPDVQKRLEEYLGDVRSVAVKINAAGDQAAKVLDEEVLKGLANSRTAFLDLDGGGEVQDTTVAGRTLDLDPDVEQAFDPDVVAIAEADQEDFEAALEPVVAAERARELDLEDMLS